MSGKPGVTSGAMHTSAVMVSVSVETVPPNAKARPVQVTLLPIVIPEGSITFPKKKNQHQVL